MLWQACYFSALDAQRRTNPNLMHQTKIVYIQPLIVVMFKNM